MLARVRITALALPWLLVMVSLVWPPWEVFRATPCKNSGLDVVASACLSGRANREYRLYQLKTKATMRAINWLRFRSWVV